jgi:hypothetical protein
MKTFLLLAILFLTPAVLADDEGHHQRLDRVTTGDGAFSVICAECGSLRSAAWLCCTHSGREAEKQFVQIEKDDPKCAIGTPRGHEFVAPTVEPS